MDLATRKVTLIQCSICWMVGVDPLFFFNLQVIPFSLVRSIVLTSSLPLVTPSSGDPPPLVAPILWFHDKSNPGCYTTNYHSEQFSHEVLFLIVFPGGPASRSNFHHSIVRWDSHWKRRQQSSTARLSRLHGDIPGVNKVDNLGEPDAAGFQLARFAMPPETRLGGLQLSDPIQLFRRPGRGLQPPDNHRGSLYFHLVSSVFVCRNKNHVNDVVSRYYVDKCNFNFDGVEKSDDSVNRIRRDFKIGEDNDCICSTSVFVWKDHGTVVFHAHVGSVHHSTRGKFPTGPPEQWCKRPCPGDRTAHSRCPGDYRHRMLRHDQVCLQTSHSVYNKIMNNEWHGWSTWSDLFLLDFSRCNRIFPDLWESSRIFWNSKLLKYFCQYLLGHWEWLFSLAFYVPIRFK